MKRRALDLFCGAGGATRGLQLAGFHVTGVDLEPQPHYCGDHFIQTDALDMDPPRYRGWDLIWASPPCQAFTAYKRRRKHVRPRANLIPATRERVHAAGVPYVIENVVGAPLLEPVLLCGSMFGLDVQRHRIFETSLPIEAPSACRHARWTPRFPPATNRTNKRRTVEVGVWRIPLDVQQRAMGIDWMTREELSQAIPPLYAEYLARRLT